MNVVFHHAWMQKHPTPTASRGDFHWHPSGVPASIRGTLTELATRGRGQRVSLWIIDESYLAWACTFSATSPADRRRYTGLAVTIAQPEPAVGDQWSRAVPEVLARLPMPEAAPFSGERPRAACTLDATPGDSRPLMIDPDSMRSLFGECDRELASAVYQGGVATSREPHADRLPALMGRLLSWLPTRERARPRTGAITESRAGHERPSRSKAENNLLHYLAGAWWCPAAIRARWPTFAVDCWQLIFDLLASAQCGLLDLFTDLTDVAGAWTTADELYDYLLHRGTLTRADVAACDQRAPSPLHGAHVADAGWLWSRVLHYWGRGFLPDRVVPRLAAVLARRIAVDHLFHLDAPDQIALPSRYVRRLKYETLLPRDHVAAMISKVTEHVPSLSRSSEVTRG